MRHPLRPKQRYNHESQFADNAKFQFKALCRKYRLGVMDTIALATGKHPLNGRDFLYRPKTNKNHFAATRADKYARMVFKFIEDFRAGMFDYKLKSIDYYGRPSFMVEKRTTPQVKICAKKLSHCPGGFYPGDCPKNWKECMLSAAAWDFK